MQPAVTYARGVISTLMDTFPVSEAHSQPYLYDRAFDIMQDALSDFVTDNLPAGVISSRDISIMTGMSMRWMSQQPGYSAEMSNDDWLALFPQALSWLFSGAYDPDTSIFDPERWMER